MDAPVSYTDTELMDRLGLALRSPRRKSGKATAWAMLSDLFGLGSTESQALARRLGIDPHREMVWKVAKTRVQGGQ